MCYQLFLPIYGLFHVENTTHCFESIPPLAAGAGAEEGRGVGSECVTNTPSLKPLPLLWASISPRGN